MTLRLLKTAILALLLAGPTCVLSSENITDLTLKANAGDAGAAFELALRYDYGRGVVKSPEQAATWYMLAAQAGRAEAQNSIGSMYQAGQGVEQSYSKALEWFQKAADQGHPEATNNLAYLYDEGKGVPEDNIRAITLYEKAAEQGFVPAMINLALMYQKGDGVPIDRIQAYMWLDLGRFYTQRSNNKQLKWYVRGLEDHLQHELSAGEITLGELRAQEWDKAHRAKHGT